MGRCGSLWPLWLSMSAVVLRLMSLFGCARPLACILAFYSETPADVCEEHPIGEEPGMPSDAAGCSIGVLADDTADSDGGSVNPQPGTHRPMP